METSFLRTFVLVADTGSMAEAARRQGITPAAVAQQVHALERELGAPLVARAGRTVLPTPAGHRLLAHAGELLRDVDSLRTVVREDVVAGQLRLGAINSALHTMLPRALGRLARAYPDLKVFIQSGLSQHLVEAVRNDALDAAVCLHPDFALSKALGWEQVREETLVVLAPAALARRDAHHLLRTQPLLRYDRSLAGGRQADRYLRQHGIVPIERFERFELSSLLAIAMMVGEGLGVALVPDTASSLKEGLQVTRVPLPDAVEPRRFGVLWRRANPRSRLIGAFLEQLRSEPASGHGKR